MVRRQNEAERWDAIRSWTCSDHKETVLRVVRQADQRLSGGPARAQFDFLKACEANLRQTPDTWRLPRNVMALCVRKPLVVRSVI